MTRTWWALLILAVYSGLITGGSVAYWWTHTDRWRDGGDP